VYALNKPTNSHNILEYRYDPENNSGTKPAQKNAKRKLEYLESLQIIRLLIKKKKKRIKNTIPIIIPKFNITSRKILWAYISSVYELAVSNSSLSAKKPLPSHNPLLEIASNTLAKMKSRVSVLKKELPDIDSRTLPLNPIDSKMLPITAKILSRNKKHTKERIISNPFKSNSFLKCLKKRKNTTIKKITHNTGPLEPKPSSTKTPKHDKRKSKVFGFKRTCQITITNTGSNMYAIPILSSSPISKKEIEPDIQPRIFIKVRTCLIQ